LLKTNLVALVLGISIGLIGTTFHQVTQDGFPLGAAMALLVALIIATSLRSQNASKTPAFVYAISASTIVFAAGLSLTDDVLVPANLAGNLWAFGLVAITIIVALWPKTKI
jgi:hypothetical protein